MLKKVAIAHTKHYSNCAFFMSPENKRSSCAHQKRLHVENLGSFYSQTKNSQFFSFARKLEDSVDIVDEHLNTHRV